MAWKTDKAVVRAAREMTQADPKPIFTALPPPAPEPATEWQARGVSPYRRINLLLAELEWVAPQKVAALRELLDDCGVLLRELG